jgi:hypothetical protein
VLLLVARRRNWFVLPGGEAVSQRVLLLGGAQARLVCLTGRRSRLLLGYATPR